MAVPDAAVRFLLENLSQILTYNYNLIKGVKANILDLQQELRTLEGLLKDYTKYNHDSQYLKSEAKKIQGIIDRAEDAVETYLLQSAVQKSRNWASKAFHNMTDYPKVLRDVGKEIEQISNQVKQLNSEKETGFLALQQQAINNLDRRRRTEPPKVEEDHVVGFDGATEEVSKLLTGGAEQFEAISIIGMLGLGKTTLAKKVVKNPKVDYEYRIRVFVYVSKEYEKREVFLKILSSLPKTNDDVNKMTDEVLEAHLHKQLTDRQYLIVLDDIWEKEDWDSLKGAFPNNSRRCRVLITTRNEEVAKHANKKVSSWYRLHFLPFDKSIELLRWKVFAGEDCFKEFKEYEIQIAKKCDGLPLAIVVISGIICNDPYNGEWWADVADSVKDYIATDQKQTTTVLDLMYKHLPNHLKPCFLYLGVFREDFEIPVWKLVRLWIAEGLIPSEGDLNLENIAERNLEELVYRNLVMVGQRRSNDKIKTCQLHDTLREFCKNQASEENLFQEIKKEKLSFFLSAGNLALDQYRRFCINNVNVLDYISSTPPQIPSGKCVRSFLTFSSEETTIDAKHISVIPKTFKLLRVLEVQSLNFACFPRDICNLGLLKYIAITSSFSVLPPPMSTLWNLQTIIVNTSSRSLDIQTDIWKMPQFRHLHTNASTTLPSLEAKNRNSLIQTLSTITPESCRKEIFAQTPKLKKLGIRGTLAKLFEVRGDHSLFGNLRNLNSLKNLKLLNDDVTSPLYSLPLKKSFPENLTKLTLENTILSWKEMSTLGKLEKLEVLKLKDNAFRGALWDTEKDGFRLLKHLHIGRTDLVVWEASVEHFPKLKRLKLYNCDQLEAIPHGLAEISSLELVVLHCTNHKVASSARRLELLKVKEAQKSNINGNFKLSIYPPDH